MNPVVSNGSIQCIISSHLNPNLSGVAKFNRILAQRFGVPCIGFEKGLEHLPTGPMLVSVKVRDMPPIELDQAKQFINELVRRSIPFDLFFHSFDSLDFEYDLVENCRKVFCGNAEILHSLQGTDKPLVSAWCPMLMDTHQQPIQERDLNLFVFGMAHKIQVRYFKMLREFLEANHLDYQLWVSTAFHEKANFGDFGSISGQLSGIFGSRIQFMGFLSDEAVGYFLQKANLFVTFFEKGVRANNTSVYAAMEKGCAVLTNIDEYSPAWMKHQETMLDIHQVQPTDFDAALLGKMGKAAQQASAQFASWDQLTTLLQLETTTPNG